MTSPYVIQVKREARALLPWWIGVAITATATSILARQNVSDFRYGQEIWGVIAYAVGVLAVAAASVGHELAHNTLSSLLVQPISRVRVLATKLGVLIPAILALGLLGNWLLFNRYVAAGAAESRSLLVWGPVIAGIGLVPLLTVLTRKPLGGVVFAIAIPGLMLAIAEHFYSLRQGTEALSITFYGTLVLSALGMLAFWYRFARLEIVGDGGGPITFRAWTTAGASADRAATAERPTRPRSWLWLFVRKELRLQQLTLAVSGLYVLAWGGVVLAERTVPGYAGAGPKFDTLTLLHGVFIALLAGSLSSAEERQLGTLTSHVLMPQAAWRQWSVKAATTAGLTCALAIGLPAMLMLIFRPTDPFIVKAEFVVGIFFVACAAMYVSSLCSNGLWALLATFPTLALVAGVGGQVIVTNSSFGWHISFPHWLWSWFPQDTTRFNEVFRAAQATGNRANWDALLAKASRIWTFEQQAPMILVAGLGLLALYFAGRNHRSLERNARLILKQASVMVLYVAVALVAFFFAFRLAWQVIL